MKKRLGTWNGRLLSIDGRVTLINSVLSSLPLYFFSFFKAPACVIKELVSIQRNFLWGGGLDRKKVCWVSWDRICQPKDKGGLGLKNLELFNASLLCKWKWRCLIDKVAPWYELLRFRYGSLVANVLYEEGREMLKHASIWWRDLWSIGSEDEGGWFGNNINNVLGDGNEIGFWKEKWLGTTSLRALFPYLYNKSSQQDNVISAMGSWNIDTWTWKLMWADELTVSESVIAAELLAMLQQVRPTIDSFDRCRWIPHSAGLFSVKSAYLQLQNRYALEEINGFTAKVLKRLWKNNVPSKVSIFGWRLLLEKLPTREALYRKGITTNNERWLDIRFSLPLDVKHHFYQFGEIATGKKSKHFRHLI
ncbi:ribonuclease H protein, partial [Trifolium medium]|nr:ribonuclease H protein [Trifolium medium]